MIEDIAEYADYKTQIEDKSDQKVTAEMINYKKPEYLIDENTKEYLEDPNNMFNLTLSNFPKSHGIYLGQIFLGDHDVYKNPYNLRIDYYVMGYTPTL